MSEFLTIKENNITVDLSNKNIHKIIIKGDNVIVKNLKMVKLENKSVQLLGDNITLSNCSFNGNKKSEVLIHVKGQFCRITNCLFENMNEKGIIINVVVFKNKCSYCLIDGNNFRDCKEGDSNGYEVIRIGDSKSSLYDSKSMIYNNFFHMCDREIELISVKSCANVISTNKIIDCKSGICLRHGRRNHVVDNYINGNYREGCCGIRISGKEHLIMNNTLEGILNKKNPFRSPISIMSGEKDNKLNGYEVVKNTSIINNDFLSCEFVFSLGVDNKRDNPVKPTKILIEGNRIVKSLDMINPDERCLGLESSFVDNNEILNRDVKIEIKNGKSIEDEKLDELYHILYNEINNIEEDEEKIPEPQEEEDKKDVFDFSDILEEITRLKNEEKESECKKCSDYLQTMNKSKAQYESKIKSLEGELAELKIRMSKIVEMLF